MAEQYEIVFRKFNEIQMKLQKTGVSLGEACKGIWECGVLVKHLNHSKGLEKFQKYYGKLVELDGRILLDIKDMT